MFSGKKYLTKGIYTNIPLEIQQFRNRQPDPNVDWALKKR